MPSSAKTMHRAPRHAVLLTLAVAGLLAACGPERISGPDGGPFAPGIDHSKTGADELATANRLMAAREYDLAMDAFTRAALHDGMTPEIITGLGRRCRLCDNCQRLECLNKEPVSIR